MATKNTPSPKPGAGGQTTIKPPVAKPTPPVHTPEQGGTPPRNPAAGAGLIPPAATPTPVSPLTNMINSLSGTNRDAFVALETLFTQYGLGSLVNDIYNFVKSGYSQDTITLLLQQTPAYQQRFAGNAIRQKNGLAVLSPADYLATEASYHQIVQAAGLPASFYDQPSDWTQWIGNDVSPTEVQSRVQMAQTATEQAPQDLVQALGQMGVPQSSLVAYFLDDTKALPLLQQQFNAAQIGASALRNNLVMDPARATMMANMGISVDQANTAYQQIGETLPTLEELGRVYNQNYTQQTAEDAALLGSGAAQLQTQKLGAQEQASFSGNINAAAAQGGLTQNASAAGRY
jgi:hypothetical protein